MKKYLVFGMMSALALAFAACSSEEELVTPVVNGQAVKTQLAINLPTGLKATRQQMVETQGQETPEFLGISDFHVAAFNTAAVEDDAEAIGAGATALTKLELEPKGTDWEHALAQDWWYDVEVPIGTNAFLVYAKADYEGTGDLDVTIPDDFADYENIQFNLVPIAEEFPAGTEVLTALNAIANAKPEGDGAVAWKATTDAFYKELFESFITIQAGSSTSVNAYLTELKKAVTAVPDAAGLGAAIAAAIDANPIAEEFPGNGLPDGAALLQYDDAEGFSFAGTFQSGIWSENPYVKPAALWYRANTGIYADEEMHKDNITDEQTWPAALETEYDGAGKVVMPTTKSVALITPLQYAVGNLETWVAFKSATFQQIPVPDTDPVEYQEEINIEDLQLTGILVGEQQSVDWQAHPATDLADEFKDRVIYDTDLFEGVDLSTTLQAVCQTLVLETDQEEVNIALEFVNNSEKAFTGVANCIIPAGTKFYLIGKLVKADGTANDADKIFQQDFKTIAKITISGLQGKAYNVVPDLRNPELELGLSVDLEWQDGYEFEIEI